MGYWPGRGTDAWRALHPAVAAAASPERTFLREIMLGPIVVLSEAKDLMALAPG
jgi:hypothetical protein